NDYGERPSELRLPGVRRAFPFARRAGSPQPAKARRNTAVWLVELAAELVGLRGQQPRSPAVSHAPIDERAVRLLVDRPFALPAPLRPRAPRLRRVRELWTPAVQQVNVGLAARVGIGSRPPAKNCREPSLLPTPPACAAVDQKAAPRRDLFARSSRSDVAGAVPTAATACAPIHRQRLRRVDLRDRLVSTPQSHHRLIRRLARRAAWHVHGWHVPRQPLFLALRFAE